MMIACLSDEGHASCLLYYFSHDRTIKRFPCIAFPFTRGHFPSTFFANCDGTLGLMIPDGFGDPIASFENPYRQADPNTSYLTIGHTPWSTSSPGAFAFSSRGHRVLTFATHGYWTVEGKPLFLYLFFCSRRTTTSSTGSTTATCSATATAPSSTWWSGWTWTGGSGGCATHRRSPSPIFVDCGDGIGVRDIANPSAPSPLLSIFIEQIQPSP